MALDTRIVTFPAANDSYLDRIKISGKAAAYSSTAWRGGLYDLAVPRLLTNGIPAIFPAWPVGWFVGTGAFLENNTYFSELPVYLVGTRSENGTGPNEPFADTIPPNQTYTLPEGYTYSLIGFIEGLIGVNEMAGTLGKYNYVADNGTTYVMLMDASNATAVGNAAAAADAVVSVPSRLKLRYILAQQTDNAKVRRKVPIGAVNNTRYINGGSIDLETVAGTKTFRITGRVGEKFSF